MSLLSCYFLIITSLLHHYYIWKTINFGTIITYYAKSMSPLLHHNCLLLPHYHKRNGDNCYPLLHISDWQACRWDHLRLSVYFNWTVTPSSTSVTRKRWNWNSHVSHSPGPASSDFDSEFVALTQSIARRQLPVSRHQRHGSVAVRVRPGSLRPGGSDSDRDPAGRARAPAPSRPMPACGGSHCTKLQFEYSAVGRRILHEESALKSSSESLHLGNKSSDLLRRW